MPDVTAQNLLLLGHNEAQYQDFYDPSQHFEDPSQHSGGTVLSDTDALLSHVSQDNASRKIKHKKSKLYKLKQYGKTSVITCQLFWWTIVKAVLYDWWNDSKTAVLFVIALTWSTPIQHLVQLQNFLGPEHPDKDPNITYDSVTKEFYAAIFLSAVASVIGVFRNMFVKYWTPLNQWVIHTIKDEFGDSDLESGDSDLESGESKRRSSTHSNFSRATTSTRFRPRNTGTLTRNTGTLTRNTQRKFKHVI
ncbi:MAG: hypothetical protein ACTSUE_05060 [Promethearchaeota archaeon]